MRNVRHQRQIGHERPKRVSGTLGDPEATQIVQIYVEQMPRNSNQFQHR
jgi:hypothetical protein